MGKGACIANIMIIIYVTRTGGEEVDETYNTAWEGLWAFAEISFGIIVSCTFLLPKPVEAEGGKLCCIFSSLTRPFTSLTTGSIEILMPWKSKSTTSQKETLDSFTIHSAVNRPLANGDQIVGRHPGYEILADATDCSSFGTTNMDRFSNH